MSSETSEVEIIRYKNGHTEHLLDTVVREEWLDLYVNGILLLQTPVSGREIRELIHGYLFAEGYLKAGEQLTLRQDYEAWHTRVNREVSRVTMKELVDCAASKIDFGEEIEALPAGPQVPANTILNLAAAFQNLPSLYHQTGGVHMAAFARMPGENGEARILHSADDISRRNAVDKVIGKAFLSGDGFSGGLLLVSGRISSDITVRMVRTGIALIVSKSAPTEKAVRIARAYGITLCGFARGRRMNIYTHPERVVFDNQ